MLRAAQYGMLWSYDLIGGAVPGNELNALLSEAAKTWMYRMHTEGGCAPPPNPEEGALAVAMHTQKQREPSLP